MVFQYKDIEKDMEITADVCVVGSGAGGATVACELAEGGLDVVVIEEGGYYKTEDFNYNAAEMISKLYRNAGSIMIYGIPNIMFVEGCCVGGSTVINGGMCWRTPEKILKKWHWEFGIDYIEYKYVEKFFEKVEKIIHVSYQDPGSIGKDSLLMRKGAEKLGYKIKPNKRNQIHCIGSNNCAFGCPTGAKQSTLLSYIPKLEKYGGRVFANTKAEKIIKSGNKIKEIIAYVKDPEGYEIDRKLTIKAKIFILAGGAFQTPILLLKNKVLPSYQPVGKYLMLHPNVKVVAIFDEEIQSWKGVSQAYQIVEFVDEGILMAETMPPPAILAFSMPLFGDDAKEIIDNYNRIAVSGVLVEDTNWGRIKVFFKKEPLFTYNITNLDLYRIKRGVALLSEVFFTAGAKKLFLPFHSLRWIHSIDEIRNIFKTKIKKTDLDLFTVHAMGTCRMGDDPKRSVLNSFCQSHLIDNLFITDASVFPTPIGVNPMETIMMLATRTADYIINNKSKLLKN